MIECEKKVDPPPVRDPTGGGQVEMSEKDKGVSKRESNNAKCFLVQLFRGREKNCLNLS